MRGIAYLAVLSSLLYGCREPFSDGAVVTTPQKLSISAAHYNSIAWLTDTQVVLTQHPTASEFGLPLTLKPQLLLYNVETEEQSYVPFSPPSICHTGRIRRLARINPGELAFLYECSVAQQNEVTIQYLLYVWEHPSDTFQLIHQYPANFWVTAYAFAPDERLLIQAGYQGEINPQLYKLNEDHETLNPLMATYARANSPAWDSTGKVIAFLGNERLPARSTRPFISYGEVASLLKHPWDLYLVELEDDSPKRLLSNILYADSVKWSPRGGTLAFQGDYEGREGIWILDTHALELTRTWAISAPYDWSPDGQQMIIITESTPSPEGDSLYQPIIISVDLP